MYIVFILQCQKSQKLVRFKQKDRNKRHSSPFINVVKGVFFVVRVTLVPVSYLSAPSAVHSYRVPGKFIRRLKSLFVGWKVYLSSTNKAKIYSYSIFVQQMYWLQDKSVYCNYSRWEELNLVYYLMRYCTVKVYLKSVIIIKQTPLSLIHVAFICFFFSSVY